MKLHEAIEFVIYKKGRSASAREIADEINAGRLYQRSDGNLVPASQILARIKNHPDLFGFEKDGRICRIENTLKDLLSIAKRMQNAIFQNAPLFNISVQQKHLLLPALFFFKRMIDNPLLMGKHLKCHNHGISFGFAGFSHFLEDLNIGENLFKGKLDELIKDAKSLPQLMTEDLLLEELASKNLAEETVSNTDFGIFFNDLIFEIGKQNSKKGEFYSPKALTDLFCCLVNNKINQSTKIYNPAAGFATIPAKLSQKSGTNFAFYGEEINHDVFLLAAMNLIINDIESGHFQHADTFLAKKSENAFGFVFCVPPLTGKYNNKTIQSDFPVNSNDLNALLIQKCALSLNENGKAFILIPESVLFSNGRTYYGLRKFLYENHLIEGIISLPPDLLYPYSGVKTSIIILSKKDNQNIVFIDAENTKLSLKNDNNGNKKIVKDICDEYHNPTTDLFQGYVAEPPAKYGRTIRKLDKPYKELDNKKYVLSAKRNLVTEESDNVGKSKLLNVISRHPRNRYKEKKRLPYVNIKDLNNDPCQINLDETALKLITDVQTGQIIKEPVLLVSSIAPNPNPTYFRFNNQPIIVSSNIHVFKVKKEKVDIEYLISQLSTEEFQNQMNSFAVGTTALKRISANDFLNLRIKLPAPEEQKEIIRIQKEVIYTRKIAEAREFAQKSGITAKSEKELLGFVKHEIGNIAGGITNDIINMKSFLTRKGIGLDEKVSGSKKAVSLSKVFDRMQSNMDDIENLMTNIEGIIYLAESQIQKSLVSFASFVKSECERVDLFKEKGIRLILRGSDFSIPLHGEKVLIDKNKFKVVIRNFVNNAIKHGFSEAINEKVIVFSLGEDKDYYYINIINNGEPFPDNFTLEDFLKFGGRHRSEKGSGIGGFLIGKVIDNHGGTIELITSGKTIYIEDDLVDFEIKPRIAIKPGVHFLIKLPKEY